MPDIKPFTVVSPDVKIGAYSIVWHFTTVEPWVEIGD
jgi:UDP-3-O-[3-hydroxymyristoyl] glucosamine N-acyltransferase